MGAFWESWQLWEKMCFVLGAAIVLTVLAGCARLIHKHIQLRKFTKLAAQEREQQMLQTEHIPVVRRGRGADVPFGVRAIESGVEVEGVWISRSNTPAPSSPTSPAATHAPGSPARPSSPEPGASKHIPQLVMPQPVYPVAGPSNKSSSPSRSPGLPHQRAVSNERPPSRPLSPASEPTPRPRGRPTYQPRQSSHLRFSSGEMLGDNTMQGTSRPTSSRSTSASNHVQRVSDSSLESDSSGKPDHYIPKRHDHNHNSSIAYASNHHSNVETQPFPRHNRGDLDQLATHRQSHAAEIGQLLPRTRNGVPSGDWGSLRSSPSDKDLATSYVNSPTTPSHDPFATPPRTRAQTAESDMIEAPSFQSFVESDPAITSRQAVPTYTQPRQMEGGALQEFDANRGKRQSQVVRKVNSAFEILQPGTLDRPKAEAVEQKGPRKLQKHHPAGSRGSQFVEEV